MIKQWGNWSVDTEEFTISLERAGRLRLFTIPPNSQFNADEVFDWIARPGGIPWLEDGDADDLRTVLQELLGRPRPGGHSKGSSHSPSRKG